MDDEFYDYNYDDTYLKEEHMQKKAQPDFGAEDPNATIVITQVVDIIYPSRDGTESMVAAAFLRAGQFIAENYDGNKHIELEFTYGGQQFHAIAGDR